MTDVLRLRRIAWLAPVALVVLATLVPARPALGHAAFVASEPDPGVRLETAPQRVVLNFTEPLNRRLTRATLLRASDGKRVELEAEAASERRFVLRPRVALERGAYRVEWHTVSTEDGHALEGSFSFGIRAAAVAGGHRLEQSPLARAGWLRVGLRFLLYAAVVLFAAALLVPLLLPSRGGSWLAPSSLDGSAAVDARALRAREQRLAGDLGWLAVTASVAATLAEAADAAGGVTLPGLRDFLLTGGGGAFRLIAVGALLGAAVLGVARRRPAAILTVIALGAIAASGHAGSASPRAVTVVNDWLHLLSGAVWLGGLGFLVIVWAPTLRRPHRRARREAARHVLPGFGLVALPAFLLVLATGLISLLAQVGPGDALWTTAYGRVLLVKIALVGLMAGASAWHAWRLRPRLLRAGESATPASVERRHWRLVRTEPVIGLGVIGAVALLAVFPLPPRQLMAADEAIGSAAACDPCPLPKPAPDELPVAGRAGTHVVAAWLRRSDAKLSGRVRVLDRSGKPSQVAADVLGTEQRSCGVGCTRFAGPLRTKLRVSVRERGRDRIAVLPATWDAGAGGRARRLLGRAQREMRSLQSVREDEEVTSGPGSYARTRYRVRAPDRMALVTDSGTRIVVVGRRAWYRVGPGGWQRRSYGSGIPFSLRRWFRWTPYATAVRQLDRRGARGRRITELALADPATPVWMRLVVDDATGRVLRQRTVTRAHLSTARYYDFDEPLRIVSPDAG